MPKSDAEANRHGAGEPSEDPDGRRWKNQKFEGDLAPPPLAEPPIEKLVRGVRFKAAELGAAADAMLARADEMEAQVVRDTGRSCFEVLGRIEAAL